MGTCFVGGLQCCCSGFRKIPSLGPIPGDHRICFGCRGLATVSTIARICQAALFFLCVGLVSAAMSH